MPRPLAAINGLSLTLPASFLGFHRRRSGSIPSWRPSGVWGAAQGLEQKLPDDHLALLVHLCSLRTLSVQLNLLFVIDSDFAETGIAFALPEASRTSNRYLPTPPSPTTTNGAQASVRPILGAGFQLFQCSLDQSDGRSAPGPFLAVSFLGVTIVCENRSRLVSLTDVRLPASSEVSGRFTMARNDPNSAACKRHGGRTSGSGCAQPRHRSRRVSLVG